jgi:hypothetical protein
MCVCVCVYICMHNIVFSVRCELLAKKQLNMVHVVQHCTTRWLHSANAVNPWVGIIIKKKGLMTAAVK